MYILSDVNWIKIAKSNYVPYIEPSLVLIPYIHLGFFVLFLVKPK